MPFFAMKSTFSQLPTPVAILQKYIYICLPDRNYVQEDSCLPDRASAHEDLADTVPLAHDDLGCPIRRDRLYQPELMEAEATPVSGPPVSPIYFRSPRSSIPERPSPKAIQASIKESATLAAAISMQWKEEVSAMRRELADLRRDLCTELRAFNSNFNTFTQHYNTWSPQGGVVATATGAGVGGGVAEGGGGGGGLRASGAERGATGGARGKKPQVSKVSVGTQARGKVLVRQSTADAAVNCPEEHDEQKKDTGSRRHLPKQLSMDPSILASPQSMFVESAIPLSLDSILPISVKLSQPVSSVDSSPTPSSELQNESSSDVVTMEVVSTHVPQPCTTGSAIKNTEVALEITCIDRVNEDYSEAKTSAQDDVMLQVIKSPYIKEMQTLPYPVPVVTVSPPDDPPEDEVTLEYAITHESAPVLQDTVAECSRVSGSKDPYPADPLETTSKPPGSILGTSSKIIDLGTVCPYTAPPDYSTATAITAQPEKQCPTIVLSEYPESPTSPTNSDSNTDTFTSTVLDHASEPLPGPPALGSSCSSKMGHDQQDLANSAEPESQEPEWPPLPEPTETAPIYHADLVHFDMVMLTSFDQDDLDSVFMDPEPDPLGLSVESLFETGDFDPPLYQSMSSPCPSQSNVDPYVPCLVDSSDLSDSACLDPPIESSLSQMMQAVDDCHKGTLPQVIVTISPPSPVFPDPEESMDLDCGPIHPASLTDSDSHPLDSDPMLSNPEDIQIPSIVLPPIEPDDTTETPLAMDPFEDFEAEEAPGSPERSSCEQAFLWYRWQKRSQEPKPIHRSASVELWSGRYEYNSSEITYMSLSL